MLPFSLQQDFLLSLSIEEVFRSLAVKFCFFVKYFGIKAMFLRKYLRVCGVYVCILKILDFLFIYFHFSS